MPRAEWLPGIVRRALVAGINGWADFRATRVVSVRSVAAVNTREAFDQVYGTPALMHEYLRPARLEFYETVADRCASEGAPSRVIDVGCGTGHLLAALLKRIDPPERAVGVDNSNEAIARLREFVPTAVGVVASVYELERELEPESFDLVLCTEVLEHLERPEDALMQLRRLRSPGGRIIVTVPDGTIDDFSGHVNFWSFDAFRSLLSRVGRARVERLDDGTLYGVVIAS
jgi:ubiquinone/menaquinone biosynthesis C-methylase UbiE